MKKIQITLLTSALAGCLFIGCTNTSTKVVEQPEKVNKTITVDKTITNVQGTKQYPYFLRVLSKECKDVRVDKEAAQVADYVVNQENVKEKYVENAIILKLEKDNKPLNFYFFTDKESCENVIKDSERKAKI